MRRRIPWSLLLGVGAGLLLLRRARGRKGARAGGARLPRGPEVVRLSGPTPVEAGLERPVASATPDSIPGRTFHAQAHPQPRPAPAPVRFEPVVPDAPEER